MPYSLALQLALGRLLMEHERHAEALEPLTRAVEIQPTERSVRVMLGTALERMGQYESSLAVAQWILETDPYSKEAHRMAAEAYLQTERFQLAIPHLRKLVNLEYGDLDAQNRLGQAYSRSGDYPHALKTFQNILKQDPLYAPAFLNLAICYVRQSLTNEAVEVMKRAASLFGRPKVREWAKASEFESVRADPYFRALLESSETAGRDRGTEDPGP